jgi:hypothetical protein
VTRHRCIAHISRGSSAVTCHTREPDGRPMAHLADHQLDRWVPVAPESWRHHTRKAPRPQFRRSVHRPLSSHDGRELGAQAAGLEGVPR